jgi:Ti-type conjugative transfer relaxase TraA
MAIAFAKVSLVSRAQGHSAVAAAAYRSGTCLTDERTGLVHDYTKRTDVVFTELMVPEGVPGEFSEQEFLWNKVESSEKRKDAQLGKDLVLALPKELNLEQQIEFAKHYAKVNFVDDGIPVDISIHDKGDGNPHAHLYHTTRRLEKNGFSKYKARDLNPSFFKGKVLEDERWSQKYRDALNEYFVENNIDIAVDLNHIIPEKHEGKSRHSGESYLREENKIIRESRESIVLGDVDELIELLSIEHSVFTRRDIEKLLFKTLKETTSSELYLVKVEELLSNKNVIELGPDERGHVTYTTRNHYVQEGQLLKDVEQMNARKTHDYKQPLDGLVEKFKLNEEQKEALSFITQGNDISLLVGKPGTGKSYLLKPVKEYYESSNCRVLGAALSSKVAKALEDDTGIQSSTIASLSHQLSNKKLVLTKHDVIVIDEAGMVDFANMAMILNAANRANAKVILVGDPQQLKPIQKGEIFRGIADRVGYISLDNITRQEDLGDREASLMLARGEIDKALAHYDKKGALKLIQGTPSSNAASELVSDWVDTITTPEDIKSHIILAFTRNSVSELNERARAALQDKSQLATDEFIYYREVEHKGSALQPGARAVISLTDRELGISGGEQVNILKVSHKAVTIQLESGDTVNIPAHLKHYIKIMNTRDIKLASGERILFKKNDRTHGVKNGDLATITSINHEYLEARLDNGTIVNVPKMYHHLDYGYATTVHKSQGMTVDNTSVFVDNKYWNRALSFVAFTRHRKKLSIYADAGQHPDLDALNRTLSRESIKDNVIDWPLDFAIRSGFDPDKLIGRALNHMAGMGHKIKEKFNYVVNYEAFIKQRRTQTLEDNKRELRDMAKEASNYLDIQSKGAKLYRALERESREKGVNMESLSAFDELYAVSRVRDKQGHELWTKYGDKLDGIKIGYLETQHVKLTSDNHERYTAVVSIAKIKAENLEVTPELMETLNQVDIQKDFGHIQRQADANFIKPSDLKSFINDKQQSYRFKLHEQLKETHPILAEYESKLYAREKSRGFRAETLDKELLDIAKAIKADKKLHPYIKQHLPGVSKGLSNRIERGLDRGHDLER